MIACESTVILVYFFVFVLSLKRPLRDRTWQTSLSCLSELAWSQRSDRKVGDEEALDLLLMRLRQVRPLSSSSLSHLRLSLKPSGTGAPRPRSSAHSASFSRRHAAVWAWKYVGGKHVQELEGRSTPLSFFIETTCSSETRITLRDFCDWAGSCSL